MNDRGKVQLLLERKDKIAKKISGPYQLVASGVREGAEISFGIYKSVECLVSGIIVIENGKSFVRILTPEKEIPDEVKSLVISIKSM